MLRYKIFGILFWKRVCPFVILSVCTFGRTFAQYQTPFMNYTMKAGLVQNQIRDICRDQRGYIWFATAGGVSKFDGKYFKNYSVSDGLPVNTVTALLVDRKNTVWMATYGGGLVEFDGKTFRTYTAKDGLASNNLVVTGFKNLLLEDSRGNIWCRTNDEGISVVENGTVKTYNSNNGLADNRVTCFAEDVRGRILCGTGSGISIIDRGQITNYAFGTDPQTNFVSDIIVTEKGDIWVIGERNNIARFVNDQFVVYRAPEPCNFISVGCDSRGRLWLTTASNGLYIFAENKFTPVSQPKEPIIRIIEDKRQNMWLLTQGNGVYRLANGELHHYGRQSGLVDNNVTCIFEDEEGNIWIGTDSGISMYGKVIFEMLTTESGFPNNHIISVAADSSGNVWCSPQNSGLVRINGQQIDFFESRNKDKRRTSNAVASIATARDRILLGSMGAGLGYFANGNFVFKSDKDDEDIYNILVVNNNEYWAASSKGLVHVLGNKTKYYTINDGLPDDYVYFLARDDKNRIWCTTALGLSVFDGEHFVNYTEENGLPSNSCTDIAIDKYGVVWLGTENGLCKITETNNQLNFKVYTVNDGLASNSINLVHADQSDRLWVGYINGLNTIDLKTNEIKYYAEDDGYLPMDCYMGAAATDTHGNVWFGTVAGLVKYIPEADLKQTDPPHTYITDISFPDGGDIQQYADSVSSQTGLPEELVLPYNRNSIRIDWIGIHFTIPAKNKYRFILEGYDESWHEESSETFREYRLSPGKYTFQVMACNNDGVWNPEPVTYSFTVRPPWWATVAAYIAYGLALIIAVFSYIRWRERALIKENRVLEEKVNERTLEIELQKQNIIEINRELKQHQEELIVQRDMAAEQRDQIDEQRQEIMDSIYYAKRIQKAIMPIRELMGKIFPDYFLFFRPRDVVSGDYYWAAQKGNKSVVVAADCTGHGVPGAFMSMLGISNLNEIVLKQGMDKASDILNELRSNLKYTLSQTGAAGEQRDGMDMALCIIDRDAAEVQYAGAYNPLYLIRNGEFLEYKADKMPVGIHVGQEKNFTNHVIPLEEGDMLYIFSDGYVDQFGGEDNSKFKTKPFKQLLTEIASLPTNQQKEILITTHDKWKGDENQIDDILVIGIRIALNRRGS